MGEDELELGPALVLEGVRIRPIARRRVASVTGEAGQATLGRLRPLGILVEDPEGVRALGLDGAELPEDVVDELPEIDVDA